MPSWKQMGREVHPRCCGESQIQGEESIALRKDEREEDRCCGQPGGNSQPNHMAAVG